ncbi:hypothetical protein ACFQUX_02945 [Pantoea stewartii]
MFKTGCTVVIGQTGGGKTDLQSQVMHVFLAQSDVSQIRDAYTDEERERLAAAIRQNTSIRYSLNPGDER